jgi:hypothetical protein
VQRWEKSEGLPVRRHVHAKLGTVYTYKAELDAWWNNRRPKLEEEEKATLAHRRLSWFLAGGAVLLALVALGVWRAGLFAPRFSSSTRLSFERKLVELPGRGNGYPVVADFNGDGIYDIAASFNVGAFPTSSSHIAIFLGTGGGNFSSPAIYDPGDGCWTMGGFETTDLNGDGTLDLVRLADGSTAKCFGNKFTVHLNDGSGVFSSRAFTTGGSPTSVVFGDFNEDGKRDLAIYSRDHNAVHLHFGDGAGFFSAGVPFPLPQGKGSHGELLSADLNGDGHMDLLLALNLLNRVLALLGTGAGFFVPSPAAYSIPAPHGLLSVDLNQDSMEDIAVVSNREGKLYIWGAGPDFLAPPVSYAALPPATNLWAGAVRIAAGDFDGDEYFDLAVFPGNAKTFVILRGDGRGHFAAPGRYSLGGSAGWRVRAADLDRDGRRDLVITGYDPPGVLFLRNTTPKP